MKNKSGTYVGIYVDENWSYIENTGKMAIIKLEPMKTFRNLLIVFVFFPVLLFSSCSGDKKAPGLPNIVFILTDDMGYGDVSVLNEQAYVKTEKWPGLDWMKERND